MAADVQRIRHVACIGNGLGQDVQAVAVGGGTVYQNHTAFGSAAWGCRVLAVGKLGAISALVPLQWRQVGVVQSELNAERARCLNACDSLHQS